MRNYSIVYLNIHARQNVHFKSMGDIRKGIKYIGYIDTIFYIPADAKMDGL